MKARRPCTRWFARFALAGLAAGCAAAGPAARVPVTPCEVVRGMPGPEDLELDRADPRGPRLIVSSLERRGPTVPGALFAVPIGGGRLGPPRPFDVVDRDRVPFRPHGISLVASARLPLLYVVNHVTAAEHAIEVFDVEGDRLRFRRRLIDPFVSSPNDVVALPDGHVYVTNTGNALALLVGLRRGSVAHFDGRRWREGPRGIGFANGIAVNAAGDRLYVGGFGDKAVHEYRRRPDTGAIEDRLRTIEVGSGVDNLAWADEHTLIVAAHPKLIAFLRHWRSSTTRAPSEVYRVDVRTGQVTGYAIDTAISAASTAILFDGRLYLGQVFDDAVAACPGPPGTP